MRFSEADVRPNSTPIDKARVGATSDARWREVPPVAKAMDSTHVRRITFGHVRRSR